MFWKSQEGAGIVKNHHFARFHHFRVSPQPARMTTFVTFCHFLTECRSRQGSPGREFRVRGGGPGSPRWSRVVGHPRYDSEYSCAEVLHSPCSFALNHYIFRVIPRDSDRKVYYSACGTGLSCGCSGISAEGPTTWWCLVCHWDAWPGWCRAG